MSERSQRIRKYLHDRIPHPRHLHGTFLHKLVGERLFDLPIWWPDRRTFAGGLAIGMFVALTPTVGVQMLISGFLCYLFRMNIPIALLCAWITNPVTIPFVYTMEYEFGLWLTGASPERLETNILQDFWNFAKILLQGDMVALRTLLVGSLATAAIGAVISFVFAHLVWDWLGWLNRRFLHLESHHFHLPHLPHVHLPHHEQKSEETNNRAEEK